MEFNPEKCEVIRVTKKKNPLIFPYKLHNIELKSAETTKYLGITIRNDLNWKSHIVKVSSKASNTLKSLKRNVHTNNHEIKETLMFVLSLSTALQFGTPGRKKKLCHNIERVQRAALRYVPCDLSSTSSVTEMLKVLNWQTLEHRRIQTKSNKILLL